MLTEAEAASELRSLASALIHCVGDTGLCELSAFDGARFALSITPSRANAARMHIGFDLSEGLLDAQFGRYTRSHEWVDSRAELSSAAENVLLLGRAVIRGDFVERASYVQGKLMRSSATLRLDDGKERKVVDGKPWLVTLSFLMRCERVEYSYVGYEPPTGG